jgi:4a-hydroxytetrahydrobiopterin dehydratase
MITTHATGGVTTRDVSLALEISQLARHWEAVAEPATSQVVEIMIEALDIETIRPFWRAVMGGYVDGDEQLIGDPLRLGPSIRFQQMDARRDQRNRLHLDVEVPIEIAAERIAASLAAGGVLVSDEFAPAWWVLSDAEGNEACICTTVK